MPTIQQMIKDGMSIADAKAAYKAEMDAQFIQTDSEETANV